ncbi:MAG: hypothetical protein ACPGO3_08085 [Magnetospiraceae bacterium]
MTRPYIRYTLTLVAGILVILGLVGGANMLVDPYRIWTLVSVDGINAAKPQADKVDQMFKPLAVTARQPQVLFLGSSRVAYGMDPQHPAVKKLGEGYNLALLGGEMESIRRNLEHAFSVDPKITHVFIGLDFFAFSTELKPPDNFVPERLQTRSMILSDVIATTLTVDATLDSLETLLSNYQDPDLQRFLPDGSLTAIPMARRVAKEGMIDRFEKSLKLYLSPTRLGNYQRSEAAYAELQRIIEMTEAHDAQLTAYINPVHALLLEATHDTGNWPEYLAWRERLAALAPYWDFSGYSKITGEPVAFKMAHWWDISHHRKSVGHQVLDRMLTNADQPGETGGFGVYVTAETVADRAAQLDEERAAWRAAHPEDLTWLATETARINGAAPR